MNDHHQRWRRATGNSLAVGGCGAVVAAAVTLPGAALAVSTQHSLPGMSAMPQGGRQRTIEGLLSVRLLSERRYHLHPQTVLHTGPTLY